MKWRPCAKSLVLMFSLIFLASLFTVAIAQDAPLVGFPDADPGSGRQINVTRGMSTLGDTGTTQSVLNLSLAVDPNLSEFELRIFDGDLGGEWDVTFCNDPDEIIFKMFKDPNGVGSVEADDLLWTWNAAEMADNDWCWLAPGDNPLTKEGIVICNGSTTPPSSQLPNLPVPEAYNPERSANVYHIVADWQSTECANEQNAFKVAVEGLPFLLAGSTIGFQASAWNPDFVNSFPPDQIPDSVFARSTYDGSISFSFFVPDGIDEMVFYDGDVDRGDDTDDPNTPSFECQGAPVNDPVSGPWYNDKASCGFPYFQTSPNTYMEYANPGDPGDDHSYALNRFSPSVRYRIQGPEGWEVINDNPSGNQEWELYRVGTPGVENVDDTGNVSTIPTGAYTWRFEGLDGFNNAFVRAEFDLYPLNGGLGDYVWGDTNMDGIQQDTESGIEGVLVNLYLNGAWVDDAVTNYRGEYYFNILAPGDYLVKIADANFEPGGVLEGMQASLMDQGGDDEKDSDGHPTNHDHTVAMAQGEVNRSADFGFWGNECPEICFDIDAEGNPLSAGEVVTEQWASLGLHISSPGNQAMIFDTSSPTCGDDDLATDPGYHPSNTEPQGNVLIIDSDQTCFPNDRSGGGTLTFSFDDPVLIETVNFLDIEENGGTIETGVGADIPIPDMGDNSFQTIAVFDDVVSQMDIRLAGSGAVSCFTYCPSECVPCVDGVTEMTVQLDAISGSRDPNETIRVWQGTGDGTSFTPTSDLLFEGVVLDGGEIVVNGIDPTGYGLLFTVEGDHHSNPYVKAKLPVDCSVKAGMSDSENNYIRVTVLNATLNGNPLCPPEPGECPDDTFGYVKDKFSTVSFGNNNGDRDWSGDWIENDPNGAGPSSGSVRIYRGKLKLNDKPDTGSEPSAAREVNLCASTEAWLKFKFKTSSKVDSSDEVVVEVSGDGGGNYTVLDTFRGNFSDKWRTKSYDISDFASENTRIRFRVSDLYEGGSEYFYVTWVKITSN